VVKIAPTGYTASAIFAAEVAVSTKAVVATCVVFVFAAAVVALKDSEALPFKSALEFTAVWTAENSVLKSPPLIILLVSESAKASLPDQDTAIEY
jgi:hypothetical protein